ncbi:MAG TPA: hypothetical protein PLQ36_00235 [Candidatus Gracilibacteria bacterium]|nr:hypothetical protein [Candidatus Gracilibacteria bacterium]
MEILSTLINTHPAFTENQKTDLINWSATLNLSQQASLFRLLNAKNLSELSQAKEFMLVEIQNWQQKIQIQIRKQQKEQETQSLNQESHQINDILNQI